MKRLRNYILLLLTVFFVILGAAMPELAAKIQDTQVDRLRKKLELNAVNLTLRQESDVWPVLQLISKEHTESPWEGETVMAETDARQTALAVLETMDQYGLLPEGSLKRFWEIEGYAEPQLLVGEDGSSALIWACIWEGILGTYITLDDATGKAVRILTSNAQTEISLTEDVYIQLEKWYVFLQDYYNIELTEVKEDSHWSIDSLPTSFVICFSSKDGTTEYELNLEIGDDYTLFNYQ